MVKVIFGTLLFFCLTASAQSLEFKNDSVQLRNIYTEALTEGKSYEWLNYLSNKIGARLAGSEGDKKAVAWGKAELEKIGLDSVWLQPVMATALGKG